MPDLDTARIGVIGGSGLYAIDNLDSIEESTLAMSHIDPEQTAFVKAFGDGIVKSRWSRAVGALPAAVRHMRCIAIGYAIGKKFACCEL